jgi:hypothetical protein
MDSPYKGAKILAGASAGEVIFFDPKGRIDKAQYGACVERPVDDKKWEDVLNRLMKLEDLYNLGFSRENRHLTVCIDGEVQAVTPDRFRWILPTATLEGYH